MSRENPISDDGYYDGLRIVIKPMSDDPKANRLEQYGRWQVAIGIDQHSQEGSVTAIISAPTASDAYCEALALMKKILKLDEDMTYTRSLHTKVDAAQESAA